MLALQVNAGKFTGKGYSLSKPTEDTFKRVISPSSLASPGGRHPDVLPYLAQAANGIGSADLTV